MSVSKSLFFSLLGSAVLMMNSLSANTESTNKLGNAAKANKYAFKQTQIDTVITASAIDQETLEPCIDGIKENGKNVRRIVVVSDKKLTDKAEWFDSSLYPFTKTQVAIQLNKGDMEKALEDLLDQNSNVDAYYHQLLRLYAGSVIPDISPNYLVIDPDTIFLNPVEFQNESAAGLYSAIVKSNKDVIAHARRLVPAFKRPYYAYSGNVHHMLFQQPVLDDLFASVEGKHNMPFWKAYCDTIDNKIENGLGASEYDLYFNYVFSKSSQVNIRELKFLDVIDLSAISPLKQYGYDYISCHAWRRKWLDNELQMKLEKHEAQKSENPDVVLEPLIFLMPRSF